MADMRCNCIKETAGGNDENDTLKICKSTRLLGAEK